MKYYLNKYHWNEETIKYFEKRVKPGCEGQYITEACDFVKQNCTLEEGDTYGMLATDLIMQVKQLQMKYEY
jgi:hypothetical protein